MRNQKTRRRHVAMTGCTVQGKVAVIRYCVDVGSTADQPRYDFQVTISSGMVQCRVATGIALCNKRRVIVQHGGDATHIGQEHRVYELTGQLA